MDCIFCKIVAGRLPCTKVYEDERVLSFMDINPLNDGHMLIIPKMHGENILDVSEDDFLAVMAATHRLARAVKKALRPEGINLLQLNGRAANQVVQHMHVHIVPRWADDGLAISQWQPVQEDMKNIAQTAEKIRNALG